MLKILEFTDDQKAAIADIDTWYSQKTKQSFFLSGWAGTGKTTIVEPILERLGLDLSQVAMACPTGNAALELADKLEALDLDVEPTTVHQLIYFPKANRSGGVSFTKKPRQKLKGLKLIIIDEAPMITRVMKEDLLSYGIPILFIGDIGQLPPVDGKGNTASAFGRPDAMLNQIHRQAAGSVLIMLSKAIRERTMWPAGVYGEKGEVTIITRAEFDANPEYKASCYYYADRIICGYNNSRHRINKDVRKLHQRSSALPVAGDRLVSLTNKWGMLVGGHPLVNGTSATVEEVLADNRDSMTISIRADRGSGKVARVSIAKSEFVGTKAAASERFSSALAFFDYGYAITCHKSQGGEWGNVLVMNEVLDRDTHEKWLYTAVTRAKYKLILVI